MAAVLQSMIGRHVSAISITPQDTDSSGTLTAASGYTLTNLLGQVDEIEPSHNWRTEEATPLGVDQVNNVPFLSEFSVTLHEILKYDASKNVLCAAWYNSVVIDDGATGTPWVKIIVTRGGKGWTFYGVMLEYSEGIRHGVNHGSIRVGQISISGAANPAYA